MKSTVCTLAQHDAETVSSRWGSEHPRMSTVLLATRAEDEVCDLSPMSPGWTEKKWSALADDFRTFLLTLNGSEPVFQQFTA
jgi:hypothetical protein